ncbi:AAA family ATPase, partial [Tremellales sp. Uapishka_1]
MPTPLATLKTAFPSSGPSGIPASSRQNRRAFVSPDVLRTYRLAAGDWVVARPTGVGERGIVAQLWPQVGLEDDAICLSATHMINLASAGTVEVHRSAEPRAAGILKSVTIQELPTPDGSKKRKVEVEVDEVGRQREDEWSKATIKESLYSMKYVSPGYIIPFGERSFSIKDLEVSTKAGRKNDVVEPMGQMSLSDIQVYEMDWRTKVILHSKDESKASHGKEVIKNGSSSVTKLSSISTTIPSYINLFTPSTPSSASYNLLGGLAPQIKLVKSLLDLPLLHPELFTLFGLTPPKGILLYGPPGTGKTALARAIASSTPGCSCIVVNGPELSSAFHGETEERLRGVFTEARKRSPCIIVLDEVDALCPKRDGGEGGEVERRVVATLLTLMDGMGAGEGGEGGEDQERVFIVAATNRPNSIDPALRRPGRFDREIEIGIPDAVGRQEILEIMLSRMPHSLTSAEILALASRTHGYVGADLSSLIRESASTAIQRWHASADRKSTPTLTQADVLLTLPTIRPSAMREVFIENPSVKWSDIGGQDDVKQKLRECVEWPLTHKDTFARLGVEAPKGVLLYGPPGCSKTMTAKALATESGINFMAVKGPELLNKYVGESEKAVREIFRKARAASPSIVFFDEIDALGSSRSDGDSSHNGVLTTLLNEMDGIEELSGVTIVAATNRPDVLDSALMRPGRLDRILYVGAPDIKTRRDIFRIRLASMAVEKGVDVDELARLTEGCSGAEVASICQDAALTAMNEDLDAPYVKKTHLEHSARTVRRRITPDMLRFFEEWRDQCGVRTA